MPVKQKMTSVAVLGAWNPAIINPEWLAQYKVIEKVTKNITFELAGPMGRLIFAIGDVRWEVDPTRLAVKAPKFKDCGGYIARILGLLPHTPVGAIGSTFVFACPLTDWPETKLPKLGDVQLAPEPTSKGWHQVKWVGLRSLAKDTRIQLTVTQLEDGVAVGITFHRNVPNAEAALGYASGWVHDKDIALGLMKEMFGFESYD